MIDLFFGRRETVGCGNDKNWLICFEARLGEGIRISQLAAEVEAADKTEYFADRGAFRTEPGCKLERSLLP